MKSVIYDIGMAIIDVITSTVELVGWGGLFIVFITYIVLLSVFADAIEDKITNLIKYICRKVYFMITTEKKKV